jgi:hypothetical protein
MEKYENITKEFLYNEYINKQKNIRTIAIETGLKKKQIQRLAQKFNIEMRTPRQSKVKNKKKINIKKNIISKIYYRTKIY